MSTPPGRLGTAEFLRRVFTPDPKKIRLGSGLRRGAVVALVVWATIAVAGEPAAASTGIAALLVGFLDRRQSPRQVARTMTAGTLALAATAFVTHLIAPWPVFVLLLLAAIAFSEGAGVAVHRDAPIILHFCGIQSATALLEPGTPQQAGPAALAILAAGAVQVITSAGAAYASRSVREYVQVAAALAVVADALEAVAGDPLAEDGASRARAALAPSGRAMTDAEQEVGRSDLAIDERVQLEHLLFGAERLRIEAKAAATPPHGGESGLVLAPGHPMRDPLLRAASILRAVGLALREPPSRRAAAAERIEALATTAALRPPEADPAARDLDAATARLAGAAVSLLRHGHGHRSSPVSWQERAAAVRSAVRPSAPSFLIGLRLTIATVLAIGLGHLLGLTHASWTANATLSVFRPDGGGTLVRLILRAVGTAAGAMVVVVVAVVGHDSVAVMTVAALCFVMFTYVYGPANYGLFAFFLSVSVLAILALTGVDPRAMAIARMIDTLLGCAVALVVAFAFPIWEVQRLPERVGNFCSAVGEWLQRLADSARTDPGHRDPEADRRPGIAVRDAVSDVVTTLRVSQLEPAGRIPVAHLISVFDHGRQCARHAIVAEHLLGHGAVAAAADARTAEAAGALMFQAAAALTVGNAGPPPELPPPAAAGDALGQSFRAAWDSAELTRRRALG